MFPIHHPEFATVTCFEFKPLLQDEFAKELLTNSLRFLVRQERLIVYGFVIMSNHFHAIWQSTGEEDSSSIRRDMLKYTGQRLLSRLKQVSNPAFEELRVNATDRKYQFWERNSLCMQLWSNKLFNQKLNYIHMNPVRAGLCIHPEDYHYSSASFYINNKTPWEFLT